MTNPTSINLLRASWTVPDTDTIQPVEKPNLRFPKGTNDYPETNKAQLKSLVSAKIPPEWGTEATDSPAVIMARTFSTGWIDKDTARMATPVGQVFIGQETQITRLTRETRLWSAI